MLLHIGFPKTATTSLQAGVFSQSDRIAYLGKKSRTASRTFRQALEAVIHAPADSFDPEAARAMMADELAPARASGRPVLISHEGLTHPWYENVAALPARCREVFGEARILVTIREQRSWLESIYLYYAARHAFDGKLLEADEWFRQEAEKGRHGVLHAASFRDVVDGWCAAFGPDSVEVLAFEQMVRDPDAFFARLGAFAGIPAGHLLDLHRRSAHLKRRPTERRLQLGRLNRALRRTAGPYLARKAGETQNRLMKRWFEHGRAADVALPDWLTAELDARYGEGNAALAARFDLALEARGYRLSAQTAEAMSAGARP